MADDTSFISLQPAPTDEDAPAIKRVFFRLRSNGNDLSIVELANAYLSQAGLPSNQIGCSPHFIHEQPQEDEVYHVVLDMNPTAAPPDVKIQEIPHELYRVHFRKSRRDPTFERLEGQWLKTTMQYSNGMWWGESRAGTAP